MKDINSIRNLINTYIEIEGDSESQKEHLQNELDDEKKYLKSCKIFSSFTEKLKYTIRVVLITILITEFIKSALFYFDIYDYKYSTTLISNIALFVIFPFSMISISFWATNNLKKSKWIVFLAIFIFGTSYVKTLSIYIPFKMAMLTSLQLVFLPYIICKIIDVIFYLFDHRKSKIKGNFEDCKIQDEFYDKDSIESKEAETDSRNE